MWRPSDILHKDMLRMLEDEIATDLTFSIGKDDEQQHIRAHSSMLLLRAPGMKDIIELAMTDYAHPSVDLPDIDPVHFRSLLKFVYANDTSFSKKIEDEKALLVVADRFGCWRLKLWLEANMIEEELNVGSSVDLLLFADAHNCSMLKEAAGKSMIGQNASSLVANTDFPRLVGNGELMKEIHSLTKLSSQGIGKRRQRLTERLSIGELYARLETGGAKLQSDGDYEELKRQLDVLEPVKMPAITSPYDSDSDDY